MYRQGVPGSGLSIEQSTEQVPGDGRFYVIRSGVVGRGFRSLRDATTMYERFRAERRAVDEQQAAAPASEEAGRG